LGLKKILGCLSPERSAQSIANSGESIMNKKKFIGIAGGRIISTGITAYLLSDSPKERLYLRQATPTPTKFFLG
jgi:hypothetical protein